jgi:hypothetical protein
VAEQAKADAGSIRNAIRWGLLLAAVGTVGFRVPRLFGEFRQWREALGAGDSLGTEGWHNVLMVDSAASVIVLVVGIGVFYLLRPKVRAAK